MSNPWDRPPMPRHGNIHKPTLYAHVGQALTEWEGVEFALARVYTRIVGDSDAMMPMYEYGRPTIFRERANAIARAADQRFLSLHDQAKEGEFRRLLRTAQGFSDRRNEVAHSTVIRVDWFDYFRERMDTEWQSKEQYMLLPTLYAFRYMEDDLPVFAYTSEELGDLAQALHDLRHEIMAFHL